MTTLRDSAGLSPAALAEAVWAQPTKFVSLPRLLGLRIAAVALHCAWDHASFRLVREVDDDIAAPGEVGVSCEWRLDRPRT
jgi:hypothetical protein